MESTDDAAWERHWEEQRMEYLTMCLSGAPPALPDLSNSPMGLLIRAGVPVYHVPGDGGPPILLTPAGDQRHE